MPNNLMFNNVASQLLVQMYGQNGSDVVPIQTDPSGNMVVSGSFTFSGGTISSLVAGTVSISGGTLSSLVAGTVSISGGTLSSLVAGTVSISGGTLSSLVAGTVSISGGTLSSLVAGTVSISGGTLSVLAAGTVSVNGGTIQTMAMFTSSLYDFTAADTGTAAALEESTATQKVYSYYVVNNNAAAATITAWLQISPTQTSSYYMDDSSTKFALGQNQMAVLVAEKFMQYTRLVLQASATGTTARCYYNAQS